MGFLRKRADNEDSSTENEFVFFEDVAFEEEEDDGILC